LTAENFGIVKTKEGTSTDEGREGAIAIGDVAVTNLDGGNSRIMRLRLRYEWADFGPSTVASYHDIEPSYLWLVFEDQRIGAISNLLACLTLCPHLMVSCGMDSRRRERS
jgi:hypothetical protein